MHYPKDFLSRSDLLLFAQAVPLVHDDERALFLGVYGKKHFANLSEFVEFTMNISSITQDWYSTGNLDDAYQYYYPPDVEQADEGEKWLKQAQRIDATLVGWLREFGVDVNTSEIPPHLGGAMYFHGDSEEFGLTSEMGDSFLEAYLADLIA